MTRILTVSSGRATPNTECTARATQGFSGAANIEANGARTTPSSEMLAAPSTKAVQTLAGGPGCSSAAITSHSNSSAGATAAAPITVGRDSSRFIRMTNMPVFRVVYRAAGVRPQAAGNDLPPISGWHPHSAAAADIFQPRVHPHVFRADLV